MCVDVYMDTCLEYVHNRMCECVDDGYVWTRGGLWLRYVCVPFGRLCAEECVARCAVVQREAGVYLCVLSHTILSLPPALFSAPPPFFLLLSLSLSHTDTSLPNVFSTIC